MADKWLVNQYQVRLPKKFKVNMNCLLTTLLIFQFIKLEEASTGE